MTEEEKGEEKPAENAAALTMAEHMQKELKECQDKYLRLLAESENTRKRMQKERHELTKYAVENVLLEFLSPLDSFRKALSIAEGMSTEVKNWAIGFEMILQQFKQVIAQHGVEEFNTVGTLFDPHLHEAIEMIESTEHKQGTILEESLCGYKMGDRIIRVARVKVAKHPEEEKK